jgi:uncharacterized protein involved in response to NO
MTTEHADAAASHRENMPGPPGGKRDKARRSRPAGGLVVFSEGFRIYFLAAAVYAVFAMLVWLGWLGVHAANGLVVSTAFAPAPHLWHAHEMVFGYSSAVLAGFFLTAVPSWTGTRPAQMGFVTLSAAVWLAGRAAVWFSASLDPFVVAAIDLAFVPLLSVRVAIALIKRPQPHNLMFLGLLALFWTGNLMVHLNWTGLVQIPVETGLWAGLLAVCAVISVVGGRVVPAFTRNAMLKAGRDTGLPRQHLSFNVTGIAAAIALPLAVLLGAPAATSGALALIAGLAQLARLAGWRGNWTLRQPILWSLHLAFAMLGVGYLLLGVALLDLGVGKTAALHVLGIGAIGGMTLAVMSRAALGHAGKPLIVAKPVAAAYVLIALAALTRFTGAALPPELYTVAMLLSGAFWIAGFGIFAAVYAPILTRPRPRPAA